MQDITEAVQRMQDYIISTPGEITPGALAQAAHYSPWYAARIFKQLTGYAPADYARRVRLSQSAIRLKRENAKITDVAFDMGFDSVDGYQRAFKRAFGCNPKEYALHPVPIPLFTVYGVKFKQCFKKESAMEVKNVFIQVVHKPERKVIIKRGIKADNYWDYCNEVGCDVWGVLASMDSLCGEPVCLWLPKQYRAAGTSEYVQGVEADADFAGSVPKGFDTVTLPECDYLMFQGEPFAEEDYCAAIENVQQAMDKYCPDAIGYKWDDDVPRIQLEPVGERGYIELRGIKRK